MASVDATRRRGVPAAATRAEGSNYWLTATTFLVAYLAINVVTNARQFQGSGITLWSPDDGLSLLLLIESTLFAPIVLLGAILSDLFIGTVGYNFLVVLASDLVGTFGYLVIAIVLRDVFNFELRSTSYANMIAVLAVVPVGAAAIALLYCGVLYYTGSLTADQILAALRTFWVGDAVGMIVVVPAATAMHDIVANERWRQMLQRKRWVPALAIGLSVWAIVFISMSDVKDVYLFDLLFLPVLWVAINYGYTAVAMALLAIQLMLIFGLAHFRIDDKDFSIFQSLMFILTATGQLLGAVVTERERATRLLQTQQSELARVSAQATTGAMAVTFAHEISQPLSSLSTYVHSARRMLEGGQSSAAVAKALLKAEAEAQRTRRIIERIRDFVSTGKLELKSADLDSIARKIVAVNSDDARARGVDLTIEEAASSASVQADELAVEQALNNLVINAIDAAAECADRNGRVVVRVAQNHGHMRLQVDDNGPGVAPEVAEHLFQAFETTKPKGMGLGLMLTQQIAERHAGRVGWRPVTPHGASFFIELPIHGPETDAS